MTDIYIYEMNIKNTKSFMQFYNDLGLNEVFSKKTSGKLKINTNFKKREILSTSKNKEKLLKNLEAEILDLDIGLKDTASNLVFEVYDKYKDEDGFLYVMYTDENVFG